MQRERGGRENFNSFSSTPFGGIMSGLFGGRDPFDDPFFTPPLFQPSMLHQTAPPADDVIAKSDGPLIQEIIDLDDDQVGIEPDQVEGDDVIGDKANYANRYPLVEHPDDHLIIADHSKSKSVSKDVTRRKKDMKLEGTQLNSQSVSYRRVTYGGINGAYYTASTTRKTGNDGMVVEESKQADRTTGQATHRISRGIHDKGHSLTTKLASDGKVDTMQTLHNLEEEDLAGFEQKWNGNADMHMFGWKSGFDFHRDAGISSSWLTNWDTGYRDPLSAARPKCSTPPGSQSGRAKKVVRINIE